MSESIDPKSLEPWCVPVPVVPSSFVPLDPEHRPYAVEVDLGRIGAFAFDRAPGKYALMYSDLQTNVDINGRRRLGSGRSGFFGGKYLKGVGRTTLAVNWTDEDDAYHSSGHLLPSGAIREYLVSCFMIARGLGDAIVPCEGVLVREVRGGAEAYVTEMLREGPPGASTFRPAPVDRWGQAISIKPDDFARFSNFVWALDHPGTVLEIADVLTWFLRYLARGDGRDAEDATPSAFVEALSVAIERGIDRFETYLRAGVYWGSFHNNFTADGRFLDLELPIVIGAPFFGATADPSEERASLSGEDNDIIGVELFDFVRQARALIVWLRHRVESLIEIRGVRSHFRDYLEGLLAALRRRFDRSHLIFSGRALEARLVGFIDGAFELTATERRMVKDLVHARHRRMFGAPGLAPRPARAYPLRETPITIAAPEPHRPKRLRHALGDYSTLDAGRLVNQMIIEAERSTSCAELIERLRDAAKRIAHECAVS